MNFNIISTKTLDSINTKGSQLFSQLPFIYKAKMFGHLRSNLSRFMTLVQAATKSLTNFALLSLHA